MKRLHNWNPSFAQAIVLQKQLACKVKLTPVRKMPKLVAGLDCAFSKNGKKIIAAVIVLKLPDPSVIPAIGSVVKPDIQRLRLLRFARNDIKTHLPSLRGVPICRDDEAISTLVTNPQAGIRFEIVETATAVRKVNFPYIPGLLSFREAPACLAAVAKLKTKPDIFIIDGQGIAHPRRLGIASHLGLFFDKPTIGCAKSRLVGEFEPPPLKKGSYSLLKDGKEIIGAVLRTRKAVKPVFVSVGHKCTLEDAIRITLACTTKYRIPEPTRLAHQLVSKEKIK